MTSQTMPHPQTPLTEYNDRQIVEFFCGDFRLAKMSNDEIAAEAEKLRKENRIGKPEIDLRIRGVTCIRTLKSVLKFFDARPDWECEVSVARTGTAYVHVGTPCEMIGRNIRISDHACVAGAFSFDGRTDNYTVPDLELGRGEKRPSIFAKLESLVEEMMADAENHWSKSA